MWIGIRQLKVQKLVKDAVEIIPAAWGKGIYTIRTGKSEVNANRDEIVEAAKVLVAEGHVLLPCITAMIT